MAAYIYIDPKTSQTMAMALAFTYKQKDAQTGQGQYKTPIFKIRSALI